MMVAGVPNVGKSSLINRLAGSRRAKVEDRPGVTRGRQWVSLGKGVELLDMPGVLWPKFEDPAVGERLAFTGAVKDDIVDIELLAMRLLAAGLDYQSLFRAAYPSRRARRTDSTRMGFCALSAKCAGCLPRAGRSTRSAPRSRCSMNSAAGSSGNLRWRFRRRNEYVRI